MAAVNPAVADGGRLSGRQRVELDQVVGGITCGVGISAVTPGADVVSMATTLSPTAKSADVLAVTVPATSIPGMSG